MPRLRIAGLPAHWLFVPPLAFAALNNITLKSETAPGPLFKIATEEVSSVVVIFALVPLLIGLTRLWPPALRPRTLLHHLGGSLLFSGLHVLGMVTIRQFVLAAAGIEYRPCPLPEMFLYEYGKDIAVYALIVATIGWFDRRFPPGTSPQRGWHALTLRDGRLRRPPPDEDDCGVSSRIPHPEEHAKRASRRVGYPSPRLSQNTPPAARAAIPAAPRFEVKTTRGTVLVAAEQILRVEAAGNYATLVTPQGSFLHRATMREIEAALVPDRFARTHRSHIVRLDAIAAIRGTDGEREITLCNGDAVPLSRRHAQTRDWHIALPVGNHLGSAKAST